MKEYVINDKNGGLESILSPTERHLSPDTFIPEYRNDSLLFTGKEQITSLLEASGDMTEVFFTEDIYLNYNLEEVLDKYNLDYYTSLGSLLKLTFRQMGTNHLRANISIDLIPRDDNNSVFNTLQSIVQSGYNVDENLDTSTLNLVIHYENFDTNENYYYYLDEKFLYNEEWLNFDVRINSHLNILLNDILISKYMKIKRDDILSPNNVSFYEVDNIELPATILDTNIEITWNYNTFAMFKNMFVSKRGDVIVEPLDYFKDHKYVSYYSTRACSSMCPSAVATGDVDVVDEMIYKPRLTITDPSDTTQKICSFASGDQSPFYDLTFLSGLNGKQRIYIDDNLEFNNRTVYWQKLLDQNGLPISNLDIFVSDLNDNPIDIYATSTCTDPVFNCNIKTDEDGIFIFWVDDSVTDLKLKVENQELQIYDTYFVGDWEPQINTLYSYLISTIPPTIKFHREYTDDGIAANSDVCTLNDDGTTTCTFCPMTQYVSNDRKYPEKYSYSEDGQIISTHYKIEIDLNSSPFGDNFIISEALSKNMYEGFEDTRPVSRVAYYHETVNFKIDFTGMAIPLYEDYYNYKSNWISRYTKPIDLVEGSEIVTFGTDELSSESKTWTLVHNLGTRFILCQCYDENWNVIYPLKQYPLSDSVYVVEWDFPVKGYSILKEADFSEEIETESSLWTIKHDMTVIQSPMIVQVQEPVTFEKELPSDVLSVDNQILDVDYDSVPNTGSVLINNIDTIEYHQLASSWTISHNLDMYGIQLQVYDTNMNIIIPENIQLLDKNTVKIDFIEPTAGSVGFKKIGSPTWKNDSILELLGLTDASNGNRGYFLLGDLSDVELDKAYGKYFSSRIYDEETYGPRTIQSDNYIRADLIEFTEDKYNYYFTFQVEKDKVDDLKVHEIGFFDYTNKMVFYSIGELIYKPKEMYLDVTYTISKTDLGYEDIEIV